MSYFHGFKQVVTWTDIWTHLKKYFFLLGIRLENLIHVVEAPTPNNYRGRGFLRFEDLTVVPIQQKMIQPKMLTEKEIDYINQYHQKCRDLVGPLLLSMGKTDGYNWLVKETTPMG